MNIEKSVKNLREKIKSELPYKLNIDLDPSTKSIVISSYSYKIIIYLYLRSLSSLMSICIIHKQVGSKDLFLIDESFEITKAIYDYFCKNTPILEINEKRIKNSYLYEVNYNRISYKNNMTFIWTLGNKERVEKFLEVNMYSFGNVFDSRISFEKESPLFNNESEKELNIRIFKPVDFRRFVKFSIKSFRLLKFPNFDVSIKKNYFTGFFRICCKNEENEKIMLEKPTLKAFKIYSLFAEKIKGG